MAYRELLIGCGGVRIKELARRGHTQWHELTTLDINADHNPDFVWDLNDMPLPFEDNTFEEIHAYQVLEHTGRQGDYKFFFAQFSEFWRILKPGGDLFASVPAADSPWVWGDPSHTRVLLPENLFFLDQTQYTRQVGVTAMSDFRYLYKADFKRIHSATSKGHFSFSLKCMKPSRISFSPAKATAP